MDLNAKVKVYHYNQDDTTPLLKILRKAGYKEKNIQHALSVIRQYRKGQEKTGQQLSASFEQGQKTSDHAPCFDCGGVFFIRTGTCHVCQTCGASQGCS